jgi:hypothetical protein
MESHARLVPCLWYYAAVMSSRSCLWATALALYSLTTSTVFCGYPYKEAYPPEEHAVMLQFQEALRGSQWNMALALCSERVNVEAAKYKSLEVFFHDIVPVAQIVQAQTFDPRGYTGKPGSGLPLKADRFAKLDYVIQILEPGVKWNWNTVLHDGRWVIDFETCPLRDFIAHETARNEWLAKDTRDVGLNSAIADTVITKVKTHITPLNGFVVGQPMLLRLELINGCDFDLLYDATIVRVYGKLLVKTQDGRNVECTVGPVQTTVNYERVKAGETAVLFDNFDVSEHYNLKTIGRYSVQFDGFIHIGLPRPKGSSNAEFPMWETSRAFPSNVIELQVKAAP